MFRFRSFRTKPQKLRRYGFRLIQQPIDVSPIVSRRHMPFRSKEPHVLVTPRRARWRDRIANRVSSRGLDAEAAGDLTNRDARRKYAKGRERLDACRAGVVVGFHCLANDLVVQRRCSVPSAASASQATRGIHRGTRLQYSSYAAPNERRSVGSS